MSEPNKKTSYWVYVLGGIFALILLATSFFRGWKYREKAATILIDTYSVKIDSINNLNDVLRDSISRLSVQDEQAVRIIYKWQTKYDTIVPKQDVTDLLRGLDQLGKTQPQ